MARGLLLSVVLHAMLVALWIRRPETSPPSPPIEIVIEASKPEAKRIGPGRSARPRLRPRPDPILVPPMPTIGRETFDTVDFDDSAAWARAETFDERGGLNAYEGLRAEDVRFLMALWREINARLPFSDLLSEYNHTGHVYLRLVVDENGHFEASRLRASAEDPVLKVIATRSVRASFAEERFPKPPAGMVVNARFFWAGLSTCETLEKVRGHALTFCRSTENRRRAFTRGEKVYEHSKAILLHGPWATEDIAQYNREESRRRSHFDPFDDLRRDPDWNL